VRALDEKEIDYFAGRMIPNCTPVRFMHDRKSVNIEHGEYVSIPGTNIIHQMVYWNIPKDEARQIAKLTGTRADFDKTDKENE
jgi:hypothetical protein